MIGFVSCHSLLRAEGSISAAASSARLDSAGTQVKVKLHLSRGTLPDSALHTVCVCVLSFFICAHIRVYSEITLTALKSHIFYYFSSVVCAAR